MEEHIKNRDKTGIKSINDFLVRASRAPNPTDLV